VESPDLEILFGAKFSEWMYRIWKSDCVGTGLWNPIFVSVHRIWKSNWVRNPLYQRFRNLVMWQLYSSKKLIRFFVSIHITSPEFLMHLVFPDYVIRFVMIKRVKWEKGIVWRCRKKNMRCRKKCPLIYNM